jgi:hypothetical protein
MNTLNYEQFHLRGWSAIFLIQSIGDLSTSILILSHVLAPRPLQEEEFNDITAGTQPAVLNICTSGKNYANNAMPYCNNTHTIFASSR